ncbi:putative P-type conjugative transfer protein TrbJ [Cetobacterium somerae ATCC BAA-474]|uniref:Putative P-type conjugative transfer protein TrbJ n=3 Tax=Cetobacterium TaxID=180162 RepID=U7V7T6_9FUSO|nr:putative P-type conjugative transfer protein TrbJ [Cetobacterium somerae ATCC BAA-474]
MKKILLIFLLFSKMFTNSFAIPVYDAANHQQNMANYQMMLLQKIEMIKTATENALQTQQQIQQLQNDATNLSQIGATILGQENQALLDGIDSLVKINDNSQSLIRNQQNFDKNYENLFQKIEKYKNMDREQLERESLKLSREMNSNLKTSMKVTTTMQNQMSREKNRLNSFGKNTGTLNGNLQSLQAIKAVGDDQANKLARIEALQAEEIRLKALEMQKQETEKELTKEMVEKSLGLDKFKKIKL